MKKMFVAEAVFMGVQRFRARKGQGGLHRERTRYDRAQTKTALRKQNVALPDMGASIKSGHLRMWSGIALFIVQRRV
jgi:transposase-like protein